MRASFYVVEMEMVDGSRSLSQTFASKAAAVKRAKWSRKFCVRARVMQGGPGGMEVAAF